jgi:methanogenic corrinoid protein MtbC1
MCSVSEATGEMVQTQDRWESVREDLVSHLVTADVRGCIKIAEQETRDPDNAAPFLLHVLQPAMYEIGRLWQESRISVAHEHLATSIAERLLTTVCGRRTLPCPMRGRIMIAAAPGELHSLGARMVSEFLEIDGWAVFYLGVNTPTDALLAMLERVQPQIFIISVTIPANLDAARDLVLAIRANPALEDLRIMFGGQAFGGQDDLWKSLGADAYATDAADAVEKASELEA